MDTDKAISGLQAKLQTLKKSTSSGSMAKETATATEKQGKFIPYIFKFLLVDRFLIRFFLKLLKNMFKFIKLYILNKLN